MEDGGGEDGGGEAFPLLSGHFDPIISLNVLAAAACVAINPEPAVRTRVQRSFIVKRPNPRSKSAQPSRGGAGGRERGTYERGGSSENNS